MPAGCAFDENGVALAGMGVGRRRLRWRRLAGHRPDQLLRAGDHAVPQQRRRHSRTPASGPASASTASTSASAWASSTSTTTAGRTSSSPTATSTRRSPTASCTSPTGSRRLLYRNLGNGRFEDVSAKAGAAITDGERRPRLRVRRLRQRRRRGRGRQQPRWPADAAAQRRRQREQLDPDQVRRHPLESIARSARA